MRFDDFCPHNWEFKSIEERCSLITSGGTPLRSNKSFFSQKRGIPWVKTKELQNSYLEDTEEHITKEAIDSSSAKILPTKSVLIAMYGATVGELGILSRPMACNQACCSLTVDEETNDEKFLFYQLLSKKKEIKSQAIGAAQQNISASFIRSLELPTPKISEQKAIAQILGTLDEKIELNRRTNETLEDIAKALFKSWFIDFGPIKAKAEGRSTGLSDDISDLFPDSFEDSELGEIPRNWRLRIFEEVIYEYIDNRGKTPPIESFDIPLVEVKHLASQLFPNLKTEKFVSTETFGNWFRKYVKKYDVLISTVGTIGLTSIVFDPKFAIAQNVLGLRFENKELSLYMFYLIKNFYFQHEINSMLVETVQKSIKRKDINQIPVIVPDEIILEKFALIIDPLIERQFLISKEIESLESLRNILLPKLISGELRIPDAEKIIEEVGI